jgi:lysozyme family protein
VTDRFPICWPYTLAEECPNPQDWSDPANFSDDPHDPGGATQCGIIQTEYDAYRAAKGEPAQSVRLMTQAEGGDIYQQQYWLPWCPIMPSGVDMVSFDMNVNGGPAESAKLLQRALGVTADGHIGVITLGAIKASDSVRLITAFSDQRTAFYKSLTTFKYFGKGWVNRVATIESVALKMAVGS